MAPVTSSSSEAGPSTYCLHSSNTATPAEPRPPVPVRILQCGICLDDFEWFALKNLVGYQEDPQDKTITAPLALLPRIRMRPSSNVLCSHGRGLGTHNRQARIRWTSALFGGHTAHQEEKKLKKVDTDTAAAPLSSGLKLGCSLHSSKDHAFCMECLAKYLDTQVKAHAWPIICPTEKCRESVSSFAVEILLGNDALQWHRLGVEHAIPKKIYCPYPECSRMIDGDCNNENEPVDHKCPYCSKLFCAMCREKAHTGNNCERRQDKMFQTLASNCRWKSCPTCHLMIEKVS
ncbi:hypothetical protein BGX24_003274, partial [Mortierella sp. AD032]